MTGALSPDWTGFLDQVADYDTYRRYDHMSQTAYLWHDDTAGLMRLTGSLGGAHGGGDPHWSFDPVKWNASGATNPANANGTYNAEDPYAGKPSWVNANGHHIYWAPTAATWVCSEFQEGGPLPFGYAWWNCLAATRPSNPTSAAEGATGTLLLQPHEEGDYTAGGTAAGVATVTDDLG